MELPDGRADPGGQGEEEGGGQGGGGHLATLQLVLQALLGRGLVVTRRKAVGIPCRGGRR